MNKFIFPRKLRLLTPYHFAFVFKKPKRYGTPQICILGRWNALRHPRIGLTVAKKYVKLAHERNYIKRVIRENFRLHQQTILAMDYVVVIKQNIANLNKGALIAILEKLWIYYSPQ